MAQENIDVRDTEARFRNKEVRLLDVRTPAEYEGRHIPGSTLIPLDELARFSNELADIAQPLVLVCRSGNRAEQAREQLAREGVTNAFVMEGGIKAWEAEGYDLKEGAKRWDLERQVRFAAGLMVLTGAALGFLVNPAFYAISAFVGAGLTFSAITNTCAMGTLLARLPYNRSSRDWNVEEQLAKLVPSTS